MTHGASKALALVRFLAVPIVTISVIFVICFYGVPALMMLGGLKNRVQQHFWESSADNTPFLAEMDKMFPGCRRKIIYSGGEDVPTWDATAYFGERYVLRMQIPVDAKPSGDGGFTSEPRFFLHQVSKVTEPMGAFFSGQWEFGAKEWKTLREKGGDFSAIGIKIDPTPVPDFQRYVESQP